MGPSAIRYAGLEDRLTAALGRGGPGFESPARTLPWRSSRSNHDAVAAPGAPRTLRFGADECGYPAL